MKEVLEIPCLFELKDEELACLNGGGVLFKLGAKLKEYFCGCSESTRPRWTPNYEVLRGSKL